MQQWLSNLCVLHGERGEKTYSSQKNISVFTQQTPQKTLSMYNESYFFPLEVTLGWMMLLGYTWF